MNYSLKINSHVLSMFTTIKHKLPQRPGDTLYMYIGYLNKFVY